MAAHYCSFRNAKKFYVSRREYRVQRLITLVQFYSWRHTLTSLSLVMANRPKKEEKSTFKGDKREEAHGFSCVWSMQQSATTWSKIPEPPWGSGGGVRRSGVPECSRFISELELEEEEGLVWSSTAITFVALRDDSFSATRRSKQLSGAFLKWDRMPYKRTCT